MKQDKFIINKIKDVEAKTQHVDPDHVFVELIRITKDCVSACVACMKHDSYYRDVKDYPLSTFKTR